MRGWAIVVRFPKLAGGKHTLYWVGNGWGLKEHAMVFASQTDALSVFLQLAEDGDDEVAVEEI